jgi:lipopolysaccharide/colanic/teichoic acid biosynthesis glycosyltransferase
MERVKRTSPIVGVLSRFRSDGTVDIVVGSIVAGIAAYAYEVAGGRVLGPHDFAPVSAFLTIHFLAFVVILLPLEQVVIRRLTVDAQRPGVPVGAVGVIVLAAAAGAVLAWAGRDRLFSGDAGYVLLVAGTVAAHGLFAVARGHLAGRARYRSYGMASGAAALVRLAAAGVVLALAPQGIAFAAAMVVGPLVVLAWRPFREGVDADPQGTRPVVVDIAAAESHLLAGLMLASAASQALLLGGPVVVALLGAGPAVVSTVFVTFTLFRAPLTLGYNLVARLLPPLTAAAAAGQTDRLVWWGRRFAFVAVALAAMAAVGAAWLGPGVVALVFGEGFRPDGVMAALVAAGVMLAGGALFAGQIHVARGDAGRLADAWLLAVVVTGLVLAVPASDTGLRVAAAFVVGEAAALAGLVVALGSSVTGRTRARSSRRMWYPALKRIFDLVASLVLLVVLAPVAAVVAVVVRRGSPGPALLRQERVGRDGRRFGLLKFRTMPVDADPTVFATHLLDLEHAAEQGGPEQPHLAIDDDPRLTSLGRRLRRWSLDEIPNLWNVVRGEMSLVGPRPLVAEEIGLIERELGGEAAAGRLSVPPGITGLAQVRGRDDIALAVRSGLDLDYVAARSISLDVWILLQTLRTVLGHQGR